MNPLKAFARWILAEEIENDKYHFEKLGTRNLEKSRRILELESDNRRLRINAERMRGEILELTTKNKKPHFKHRPKKGVRK